MEKQTKERPEGQRKPLRAVVADLDQEILRLLMRRHNLLAKISKNGRVAVADEKFLRESWQNNVARVSRDPELSGHFFALMNQLSFLPRPIPESSDAGAIPRQRDAFVLSPPLLPAQIDLTVPLDDFLTRVWTYLACRTGQPLLLSPCLQNDSLVDYIQGLAQLGGGITREGDAIVTRAGHVLGAPDKVIYVGDSHQNFYIFAAHYLGCHGRVRFNGSKELELADFSALNGAIAALGGRLIHIVPHSSGLPVRLETSGLLPPGYAPSENIPAGFLEALLLCAPFYERPFALDLSRHARKESIKARILPILTAAGCTFVEDKDTINVNPSPLIMPSDVDVPMCGQLALFMAALPSSLGGTATLRGSWPAWEEQIRLACGDAGWQWQQDGLSVHAEKPLQEFSPRGPETTETWHTPLLVCLAVCATLHGGTGKIGPSLVEDANTQDFLRAVGCVSDASGCLSKGERTNNLPWNAPSPAWALALAVAAGARSGKAGWPLGNPGIITALWPQFWAFYNRLPKPAPKKSQEEPTAAAKPQRRRIRTNAVVKPPEIREEDWD